MFRRALADGDTVVTAEAVPDSEEEQDPSANPGADPRLDPSTMAAQASKEAVMQLVGGVSHPRF